MDQRFYATNQTNRSLSFELPTINPIGHLNTRYNKQNQYLYNAGEKQLKRSLSREQQSMSRGKKNYSSKGSIHNSLSNQDVLKKTNSHISKINENKANNIVQEYMQVQRNSIEVEQNIIVKKFTFNILSYLAEISLAYGLIIGIMYLIKAAHGFPFYLILLVFGLAASITPWNSTNILIFVSLFAIIANFQLNIQILTYPVILISYFCIQIFNQQKKTKLLFVPIMIVTFIWGFQVIPSVYGQFVTKNNIEGFYYVFPVFMFMIRTIIYLVYRQMKYSQYIFLQLPFFALGIQYGVIMTLNVSRIQFWYLMVFFTLSIINDRTQFLLGIIVSVTKALRKITGSKRRKNKDKNKNIKNSNNSAAQLNQRLSNKQVKKQERDFSILASHASGYSSINSIHIICLVYIFTRLQIYSPPYTASTNFKGYISNQQYIPAVIWALALVYEIMCLVLQRRRPDKFLVGFVDNGIWHTIQRGVILSIGFWIFYLGLGIGIILGAQ